MKTNTFLASCRASLNAQQVLESLYSKYAYIVSYPEKVIENTYLNLQGRFPYIYHLK